jgi:hypothetical protein
MIIPFSLATAVMIFGWLGLKNTAGFIVFAILYGFLSGAFISLLPSVFMVSGFYLCVGRATNDNNGRRSLLPWEKWAFALALGSSEMPLEPLQVRTLILNISARYLVPVELGRYSDLRVCYHSSMYTIYNLTEFS